MTLDKVQIAPNSRKKATAGVVFLVMFILVWQIAGMFGRTASAPSKANAVGGESVAVAQTTGAAPPPMVTPKPAELPQTQPLSDREVALMTLQQETQVKYLEALNQLQMLKVSKDIAVANKDISAALLGKVEAEKKIVDLLAGPAVPMGASATTESTTTTTTGTATVNQLAQQAVSYSVVSISQVQYRWGAVIAFGSTLYNVHVGDVLPPDGSTVIAIAKDSVTLQKEGTRKKVSLVSII
jgi:type IV pilus biogenesis protein PilP